MRGLKLLGPKDAADRIPVFSFSIAGFPPVNLARELDAEGIAIRAGDLAALPLLKRSGVEAAARASCYLYTNGERERHGALGIPLEIRTERAEGIIGASPINLTPAQDMQANLGKVLRLHDDGSVPDDVPFVGYFAENPLVDDEAVYGQIWSLGHRNVLGLAWGLDGELWENERGPAGGD